MKKSIVEDERARPLTPEGHAIHIRLRPIRAEDFALEKAFVDELSPATGYQRFMSTRRLSTDEIRRLTDIDREREAALIATTTVDGRERQIGVARYVKVSESEAEFAIVLADAWQRRGLGAKLLATLISTARYRGVRRLVGTTFSENSGMLALARRLDFTLARHPDTATVTTLTLDLA